MDAPAEVEREEEKGEELDVRRRGATAVEEGHARVLLVEDVKRVVHEYADRPVEETLRRALHGAALSREKPQEEHEAHAEHIDALAARGVWENRGRHILSRCARADGGGSEPRGGPR